MGSWGNPKGDPVPDPIILPPGVGHTTKRVIERTSEMKANFFVFVGLALGLGAGSAALAGPDLVPNFSTSNGRVNIQNAGNAPAGASWVTVNCSAQGGGSCPDPAPAAVAPYENPAFPNRASFQAPGLNAGGSHNHVLGFWNSLAFAPGTYVFTVCVDAGSDVAEDNEGNNCRRFTKRVRGGFGSPGGLKSNSAGN